MRTLTVGSLFSGIGGIDLGLERAGMRVLWHSEIDPYASRVLAKHWPGVPNHGDITKIDFAAVESVDVLAGGFPCQDISYAGEGAGIEGERSGLWSEYARAIRELRPRYIFVENVAALLARGLGRVLGDLAALGYDAEWDCIPAAAIGAPHRRDRLWLVAYSNRGRSALRDPLRSDGRSIQTEGLQRVVRGGGRGEGDMAHAPCVLGRGVERDEPSGVLPAHGVRAIERYEGRRHGLASWWSTEPAVGRVAHGVPSRVDRLRGLGNAVVPQIPELIGGWVIDHARATGYLEVAA